MLGLMITMAATLTYVHVQDEVYFYSQTSGNNHATLTAGDNEIKQHIQSSVHASLLIIIIGVIITLLITQRMIQPIDRLTRTAERLAEGQCTKFSELQTDAQDEIGKLSRAFVKLMERNSASQAALEQQIHAVNRAESKFKLFFSQSTDLLGIADYETRIIMVNSAFLKTLDLDRDEVEGHSYLTFVHPDDISKSMAAVEEMKQGKDLVEFENRFRRKDGTYRLINWNVASHIELSCIYAVGRDITEQRLMEEEVLSNTEHTQERIARDIHDGLGQIMTGLAYKAKLIEGMLIDKTLPDPQLASEIVQLANQANAQARSLARGLDPLELQHGLPMALETLAQSTRDIFYIDCSVEYTAETESLEKIMASHLYRIAQEAVNNAIRHAKPKHISIYLNREDGWINLVVINDGNGPVIDHLPEEGRGMRFMKYRAKVIGGTLSILPAPNNGMMVKCSIKLKDDPDING